MELIQQRLVVRISDREGLGRAVLEFSRYTDLTRRWRKRRVNRKRVRSISCERQGVQGLGRGGYETADDA